MADNEIKEPVLARNQFNAIMYCTGAVTAFIVADKSHKAGSRVVVTIGYAAAGFFIATAIADISMRKLKLVQSEGMDGLEIIPLAGMGIGLLIVTFIVKKVAK